MERAHASIWIGCPVPGRVPAAGRRGPRGPSDLRLDLPVHDPAPGGPGARALPGRQAQRLRRSGHGQGGARLDRGGLAAPGGVRVRDHRQARLRLLQRVQPEAFRELRLQGCEGAQPVPLRGRGGPGHRSRALRGVRVLRHGDQVRGDAHPLEEARQVRAVPEHQGRAGAGPGRQLLGVRGDPHVRRGVPHHQPRRGGHRVLREGQVRGRGVRVLRLLPRADGELRREGVLLDPGRAAPARDGAAVQIRSLFGARF